MPARRTYAIRSPAGDHAGCSSAAPEAGVRFSAPEPEASTVNRSGSPSRSERNTSTPLLEPHADDWALASVAPSPMSTTSATAKRLTVRTGPL